MCSGNWCRRTWAIGRWSRCSRGTGRSSSGWCKSRRYNVVAMAALPNLITVDEFRQLPESGEYVYELHHGEVVAMSRPSAGHWNLQHHLMDLLRTKVADFGIVGVEFPYRAAPEFELRATDVAIVSH